MHMALHRHVSRAVWIETYVKAKKQHKETQQVLIFIAFQCKIEMPQDRTMLPYNNLV